MKNRHTKTIEERFGINTKKDELCDKVSKFNNNLKYYYRSINKNNKDYDFNDALNFCSVMTLGTFYMKALCEAPGSHYGSVEFGEAAYIVYETPARSVKFSETEFQEYAKFDVLFVTEDGYMAVVYHDLYNNLECDIVQTNKVILNGNIGKLQKD